MRGRSAAEVDRMVCESLDALFAFDIPLPAAIIHMHLEGIDNALQK